MLKRLACIVVIAAAAASGCLSGSGAIRGQSADENEADTASAMAIVSVAPSPAGR